MFDIYICIIFIENYSNYINIYIYKDKCEIPKLYSSLTL